MDNSLTKKLMAEGFGTFFLVFAGTCAIVVNDLQVIGNQTAPDGGFVSHVGVALTFGLIVFAMIAAVGDVSGAHLNPAVTIGFFVAKRFPGKAVLPYVLSQCGGAILASVIVWALFPESDSLGETVPSGSLAQSWFLELILTLGLMYVILSVSTGAQEKGITAGLAIGAMVGLEALFAGPISGASMNPARSLGPALISGNVGALWVYLTAPIVGALLAVPVCKCTREANCCGTQKDVSE
jgi:aquaporin Z